MGGEEERIEREVRKGKGEEVTEHGRDRKERTKRRRGRRRSSQVLCCVRNK